MTLTAALDLVATDYRLQGHNPAPLRCYKKNIERLLGMQQLEDCGVATLRAYAARRQDEGAAGETVNRELSTVGRAWALAVELGLTALPRPKIPRVRTDTARQGFLASETIEAIAGRMPPASGDLVRFLAETGWRRGEALGLTWAEVDGDTVRLLPAKTKARDGRMFPMTDALRDILGRRRAASPPDVSLVFPVHPKALERQWRRAAAGAGVPRALPHDLRRSAARRFERAGVTRSVTMRLVGWRSAGMFERYCIVGEEDLREAVRRLGHSPYSY